MAGQFGFVTVSTKKYTAPIGFLTREAIQAARLTESPERASVALAPAFALASSLP